MFSVKDVLFSLGISTWNWTGVFKLLFTTVSMQLFGLLGENYEHMTFLLFSNVMTGSLSGAQDTVIHMSIDV